MFWTRRRDVRRLVSPSFSNRASARTNGGRLKNLLPADQVVAPGVYRLVFDTHSYFAAQGKPSFYPHVMVVFQTLPGESHYHVPLLVGPFGYTTYRGS